MMIKTPAQWHEDDLRTIENYRPIDDDFMRVLFKNDLPLAQTVLRIITGIEDLELISEETQYDAKRLQGGRSLCLDVLGKDSQGRMFNLEVQRADKGATPQRARYHSSVMDVEFLHAKQEFVELPITYVIFITESDVREKGKLLYSFAWTDTEDGTPLDDGAHILFVNGAYDNQDDTSALAQLVHDFRCKRADEMRTKALADKTRYLKDSPEGVSEMCKAIEDMRNEAAAQAAWQKAAEIAMEMLASGTLTHEQIAQFTKLTLDEVAELAQSVQTPV